MTVIGFRPPQTVRTLRCLGSHARRGLGPGLSEVRQTGRARGVLSRRCFSCARALEERREEWIGRHDPPRRHEPFGTLFFAAASDRACDAPDETQRACVAVIYCSSVEAVASLNVPPCNITQMRIVERLTNVPCGLEGTRGACLF